jgi:hypothetical protein
MHAKCPFAAPITVGRARCRHALEVVRRGGSEYDCVSADSHAICVEVFGALKRQGLEAFAVEDDLTSMPHSVSVKIQTGGLDGLRRLLGEVSASGSAGVGSAGVGSAGAGSAGAGSAGAGASQPDEAELAGARDIAGLIAAVTAAYGGVASIPFAATAPDMLNCKLERRGRRRGG